jgi:DNA-binding response OmpR family regulator
MTHKAPWPPRRDGEGDDTRRNAGTGVLAERGTATILVLCRDVRFVQSCFTAVADDRTRLLTRVEWTADGRDSRGPVDPPDVVVIDAASLLEAKVQLRRVRRRWRTTAILVANAQDENECQLCIDEGADDACAVGSRMLRTRLQALARRARALNGDLRVALGDIVLDREHRRAWCAGSPVTLTPREFELLLVLFENAPEAVEKHQIAAAVWATGRDRTANAIEVYVGYLRRKLRRSTCLEVRTQRNYGYALAYRGALDPMIALSAADSSATSPVCRPAATR